MPDSRFLQSGDRVELIGKKQYGYVVELPTDCILIQWDGTNQPVRHPLQQHVRRVGLLSGVRPIEPAQPDQEQGLLF